MKVISEELQLQLIYLIQKAFEYEGDVFGRDHNDATDALSELKAVQQSVEPVQGKRASTCIKDSK